MQDFSHINSNLRKRDAKVLENIREKYNIDNMIKYLQDPVTLSDKLNNLYQCEIELKTTITQNLKNDDLKITQSSGDKNSSPITINLEESQNINPKNGGKNLRTRKRKIGINCKVPALRASIHSIASHDSQNEVTLIK
jgi:hypothetical protein